MKRPRSVLYASLSSSSSHHLMLSSSDETGGLNAKELRDLVVIGFSAALFVDEAGVVAEINR